jgi:Phage integrase family
MVDEAVVVMRAEALRRLTRCRPWLETSVARSRGAPCGQTPSGGPHTLRHAFITAALDAGVPLRNVQEAASHADPRTTMRYDRGRQSVDRHATYIVATFARRFQTSRPDPEVGRRNPSALGHQIGESLRCHDCSSVAFSSPRKETTRWRRCSTSSSDDQR